MIEPFRRARRPGADRIATAVRALAALLRSGVPPRLALERWHEAVPADLAAHVAGVSRRVLLGREPADAIASAPGLGGAAPALARCLRLHGRTGGSLPKMLDALADGLQRGDATARRSRAATSGARLSGRLVAGLPLACVPLMPGARTLGPGALGPVLLVAGTVLAGVGLWWIGRLVPPPLTDDAAAALAGDLAVALDGGAALVPALDAVAALPPPGLEETLARARARVTLGRSWIAALEEQDGPVAALAHVLRRSADCGVPAAAPLREWARARRDEVRTEFDRALQRAPVLMVVPLTVCVLPAFALLAFGPFLLGAIDAG